MFRTCESCREFSPISMYCTGPESSFLFSSEMLDHDYALSKCLAWDCPRTCSRIATGQCFCIYHHIESEIIGVSVLPPGFT